MIGRLLFIAIFLFSLAGVQAGAQVLHLEERSASVSGHAEQDLAAVLSLVNSGRQTIEVEWLRGQDILPEGWEVWVCDRDCQPINSKSHSFVLYPGEQLSDFRVVFRPHGQKGTGSLSLILRSPQGLDKDIRLSFSATANPKTQKSSAPSGGQASNGKTAMNQPRIYPNPATEYFSVQTEGHDIRSVEVYNALGRKVANFVLQYEGERLRISELNQGMYMVRLIDSQGRIVRTQSLSKNNP